MGNIERDFHAEVEAAFRALVAAPGFPCLGAKAALNANSFWLRTYCELGSDLDSAALARHLGAFVTSEFAAAKEFVAFVAVFARPLGESEQQFEQRLWSQLRKLNRIDAARGTEWDSAVASDPRDPHFSYSFAGHAFYVIGMHGNSSRLARCFPWPTLVFNLHEQFERLRAEERWQRMKEAIRAREVALQGNINPMLSDFGKESEARQYSGRIVAQGWQAPFAAAQKRDEGPA